MNRIADRDYEFYDFNDESDHEPCSRFANITNINPSKSHDNYKH